jgi:pyruvate dehydrogenase E1 component alpha subunit/2-oxoisovalerate dehydrogenase E1 component alpha subunit
MVVAKLLRLSGHGEHDDALYVDSNLKKSPLGRDCNILAEEILINNKWATKNEIQGWKKEYEDQIESLVKQVVKDRNPIQIQRLVRYFYTKLS